MSAQGGSAYGGKKHYQIIFLIILVVAVIFLSIRFFSGEDDWICNNDEWVKHGNPSAEKPSGSCGEIIEEAQPQPVEEANIVVFVPKEDAAVGLSFDVEGKARVFENVVNIKLKDKNGKILFRGTANAQSPDMGEFGLFRAEIKYATLQMEGTLEVFESSAKDGSEINKVVIPLKFSNEENE